jgi:hypothetical protein
MNAYQEIIERIRSSYSSCMHYYDAGIGISRSGGGSSRHVTQHFFTTSFSRGLSLTMTVHLRDNPVKGHHNTWVIAAQTAGASTEYWFGARGNLERESSLHLLLARSGGVCRGLTSWTLPLLVPDAFGDSPLQRLKNPSISEAKIDGVDCLCLSSAGTSESRIAHPSTEIEPSDTIALWVDKRSSMIKKTLFTLRGPDLALEQEATFDFYVKGQ